MIFCIHIIRIGREFDFHQKGKGITLTIGVQFKQHGLGLFFGTVCHFSVEFVGFLLCYLFSRVCAVSFLQDTLLID